MKQTRREFVGALGAGAGALSLYSHDLFAETLALSPKGSVLETRFKGLADIALGEAKLAGCSYADIRFTFTRNLGGGTATFTTQGTGRAGAPGGGGGGGGGRGGGGGGGGGAAADQGIPLDADRRPGGFGVRVMHGGVWGFAASPIINEMEIKRITRIAAEIAKASAVVKKESIRLAPVERAVVNYVTPMQKNPLEISAADKQAWAQAIADKAGTVKGVTRAQVSANVEYEWRYFASSEGSYIEQELYTTSPTMSVTASIDGENRTRNYPGPAGMGGWEWAENSKFLERAEQVADDAVQMCTAKPLGSPGPRDLILAPAHAMLTIHEIVGHATEVDRIVGYEANYAGTSFIKLADVGKLKYGSKHFNITADRAGPGIASLGYDDDGVKTQTWPLVREGVLVGLQTNRETAHYVKEEQSRGCTYGTTWRDYPFLRMPNVHLDAGPAGSPTKEELIADVRNGVMIDGRGSYSIDQQRYNGQFGGHVFWEIKNGKITRMVTDVTYNAITTEFWGKLDGVTGKDEWEMHGTSGDAKGQPTQTQAISHGSPWLLIRNIMVGAAFGAG